MMFYWKNQALNTKITANSRHRSISSKSSLKSPSKSSSSSRDTYFSILERCETAEQANFLEHKLKNAWNLS